MLATTDSLQMVVGEGGGTQVTPVLCCAVCKERLAGMDRRTPLALRRRHLAKADGDSRTELDALRRDRSIGWSRPQGTQLERAVVAAVGQLITEFQEQPGRFLAKTDLQAQLFANLRACVARLALVLTGGDLAVTDSILTNYLGMEVVCLDPDASLRRAPLPAGEDEAALQALPVFCGIELEYRTVQHRMDADACLASRRRLGSAGAPPGSASNVTARPTAS